MVAVCDARSEVIALLSTSTSPLPRSTRPSTKPSQQPGKETQEIGEASRSEDFAIANIGDLRCTGWAAESGSSLLAAPLAQQVLVGGRYGAGPNGGKTHLVMTSADALADSAAERLAAYPGNEYPGDLVRQTSGQSSRLVT